MSLDLVVKTLRIVKNDVDMLIQFVELMLGKQDLLNQ